MMIGNDWIEGKEYFRQGDLFFIPYKDFNPKKFVAFSEYIDWHGLVFHSKRIRRFNFGRHKFSEAYAQVQVMDLALGEAKENRECELTVYAKGYARHPEHGQLKLGDGKTWYLVRKNRAVRSIGFNGND